MRCALSLITVLLVAATAATSQGDDKYSRESLRGLKGVEVVVENLNPDAERDGLYKTSIQTDVELRLRQAGIKVLTQTEALAVPGMPYLYICISMFRDADRPKVYIYSDHVGLRQTVRLERDPSIRNVFAATWTTDGVGIAGTAKFSIVRDTIKDDVDKFINAYLSVNPK